MVERRSIWIPALTVTSFVTMIFYFSNIGMPALPPSWSYCKKQNNVSESFLCINGFANIAYMLFLKYLLSPYHISGIVNIIIPIHMLLYNLPKCKMLIFAHEYSWVS